MYFALFVVRTPLVYDLLMKPFIYAFVLLLVATPARAQDFYASFVVGADTILADNYEVSGEPGGLSGGGTAPFFGVRLGGAIGSWWGAEIEVAQSLETKQTFETPAYRQLSTSIGSSQPYVTFAGPRITTVSAATYVTPSVWVLRSVGERLDLVFLGGVSFNRSATEQTIEGLPGFVLPARGILDLGVSGSWTTAILPFPQPPITSETTTYDVGAVAGFEARIRFGEHLRVVPGIRLSDIRSDWSVRPSVAVAWAF